MGILDTARHIAIKEYLYEALGTCCLLLFGTSVVAQVVLSNGNAGDFFSINIGWSLGVLFGIYFTFQQSVAHLNPAITISLTLFKKFPIKKAPGYVIAQITGAFLGACLTYFTYSTEITLKGMQSTAIIFTTYPNRTISNHIAAQFWSEFIASFILMLGIHVISDPRQSIPKPLIPILVATLVLAIGMIFGFQTGYAMNPARDFGPRLLILLRWGAEIAFWTNDGYLYFWVPILAPIVGCVVANGLYFGILRDDVEGEKEGIEGEMLARDRSCSRSFESRRGV